MEDTRADIRNLWKRLGELTDLINANRQYTDSKVAEYDKAAVKLISDESLKVAGILAREENNHREFESLAKNIDDLAKSIAELTKKFVSKEEFFPVKAVVFSLMSLMGIGVVTAILRLVLPHAEFTQ